MDQANLDVIDRLRSDPPAPYRDRRPVLRVVDVVGRNSGQPRPFPVNVTAVDQRLYLCSATRDRDWVRNLLAAAWCRVERDGPGACDTSRRPVLVEADEAARVLAVYLPQTGYHDAELPFALGAPFAEMARLADHTAVVRLDPA